MTDELLDTRINSEIETSEAVIIDTPDNERDDFFAQHDFFQEDSCYYQIEQRRGGKLSKKISNFLMRFLYLLDDGSDDAEHVILIQRQVKEKEYDFFLLAVRSSQLTRTAFEAKLKSKRCTYYGTQYTFQRICEFLMLQEREAKKIEQIGWDNDNRVYAFNDSILCENQIIEPNEHNVVDAGSQLFYLTNKYPLYNYKGGNLDFKKWAAIVYDASDDNAISGIIYLLMALFRDYIFTRLKFFPHLFLYGEGATGKTNFIQHFLSIFGIDTIGDPLDNSTAIGLSRKLNQRVNSLYYLKEYKPEVEKYVGEIFLSGYDGAGRLSGIKSTDNNTQTLPVKSAIALDGNYLPSTSVLLRRMIVLQFEKQRFSDKNKNAFDVLIREREKGLNQILKEIISKRDVVEKNIYYNYHNCQSEVRDGVKEGKYKASIDSLQNHIAIQLAIFDTFSDLLEFPFNRDKVVAQIKESTEKQQELFHGTSIKGKFWEAFAYMATNDIIKGYRVDDNGSGLKSAAYRIRKIDNILQIKLDQIYPFYVNYCKNTIQPTQSGRKKSHTDKTFGSCYQFRLKNAKAENNTENPNKYIIEGYEFDFL